MILEINIERMEDIINIAGANESKLKIVETFYNVPLTIHRNELIANTNDDKIVAKLNELFKVIMFLSQKNISLNIQDILYITKMVDQGQTEVVLDVYVNRKAIINSFSGRPIFPKTKSQMDYINAIQYNDLVFSTGSAGSGKTYLAVVMAVKMLKENSIKKIILTRPAVEAGESLGFLPGDLKEKIDPYLRPLYDALYDTLGKANTDNYIEKGIIEIAPLAYMRGRTLDNACVILDEAQNTTSMQMKMFLTRLGFNSKMIVTGDISQTDLPKKEVSGLKQAATILKGIRGIAIIDFLVQDVIRHPIVQEILLRYENEN